jgi:hypothetical protein
VRVAGSNINNNIKRLSGVSFDIFGMTPYGAAQSFDIAVFVAAHRYPCATALAQLCSLHSP